MTRQRWEYASVIFENLVRKITTADPEYERLSVETRQEWETKQWQYYWWIQHSFYIWLPGAEEPDKRIVWESGEEKNRVNFLDVLNELGADGWEVVSDQIRNSAMGTTQGRETASFPVLTRTLLKRPAGPASPSA